MQKTSPIKGNNLKSKKPSVRAKLNDYNKEIRNKSVSKEVNIDKNINKSKDRVK